nr:BGTF surface domain-containing protein [Haloarcula marismortui]
MVFSVFAGTVALSGGAAAANLDAGTFYSGQEVTLDVAGNNADYEVRTVDDSGDNDRVGSLRRTVNSGDNGEIEFDLDDRLSEGDFVIQRSSSGQVVDLSDRSENDVSSGNGLKESETFEVVLQDLTADFDDSEVGTTGDSADVEFEIESDVRNGYSVNVSSDNLDRDELADIFVNNLGDGESLPDGVTVITDSTQGDKLENVNNADEFFDDTEKIQIIGNAEAEYTLNFTDINEGNYTIETNVTDSDASDSDSIEVADTGDDEAAFEDGVVSEERGDVANITIQLDNTDEATVQVGDKDDDNYYAIAEVTDDDEDGQVYVKFNSYQAGSGDADEVLVAGDDDTTIDNVNERTLGNFNEEGTAGADILEATDYDMLTVEGHVGIPDNSTVEIEDEDDVGTLSLGERTTETVQLWRAPSDTYNDEISDLEDDETAPVYDLIEAGNITQTDEAAINDVNDDIIIQVEASGLEGVFTDGSGDIDTSDYGAKSGDEAADGDNNPGAAFQHELEDSDPGANSDGSGFDIDQISDYKVIYDEANDTHFVAIDGADLADNDELNLEDEDEYAANFTVYDSTSDLVDDDDDSEVVNDSVQFVDADATLNNDDDISVQAGPGQQFFGTTNVAPSSEVTVRLRSQSSSSPFLLQPETAVTENGTFTATADLSERSPGTNFTAQTRVDGSDVGDDIDGTIVEGATATVSISDQESDGSEVVVDNAQLSAGGFIAIHAGNASGDVVGNSEYLEEGSHEDITITLDEPMDEDFTAVAMPHLDTNGNEAYDFPGADDPYTSGDGPVTDSANVTVTSEEEPTETETEPPETEEQTEETTTMDSGTDEAETTEASGPGFTAAIALIALVAAALLAVRRDN